MLLLVELSVKAVFYFFHQKSSSSLSCCLNSVLEGTKEKGFQSCCNTEWEGIEFSPSGALRERWLEKHPSVSPGRKGVDALNAQLLWSNALKWGVPYLWERWSKGFGTSQW